MDDKRNLTLDEQRALTAALRAGVKEIGSIPVPADRNAATLADAWADIYKADLIKRLRSHAAVANHVLPGSIYYACGEAANLLAAAPSAPVGVSAEDHTSLPRRVAGRIAMIDDDAANWIGEATRIIADAFPTSAPTGVEEMEDLRAFADDRRREIVNVISGLLKADRYHNPDAETKARALLARLKDAPTADEKLAADLLHFGTAITLDGKRIAPEEFFKPAADEDLPFCSYCGATESDWNLGLLPAAPPAIGAGDDHAANLRILARSFEDEGSHGVAACLMQAASALASMTKEKRTLVNAGINLLERAEQAEATLASLTEDLENTSRLLAGERRVCELRALKQKEAEDALASLTAETEGIRNEYDMFRHRLLEAEAERDALKQKWLDEVEHFADLTYSLEKAEAERDAAKRDTASKDWRIECQRSEIRKITEKRDEAQRDSVAAEANAEEWRERRDAAIKERDELDADKDQFCTACVVREAAYKADHAKAIEERDAALAEVKRLREMKGHVIECYLSTRNQECVFSEAGQPMLTRYAIVPLETYQENAVNVASFAAALTKTQEPDNETI